MGRLTHDHKVVVVGNGSFPADCLGFGGSCWQGGTCHKCVCNDVCGEASCISLDCNCGRLPGRVGCAALLVRANWTGRGTIQRPACWGYVGKRSRCGCPVGRTYTVGSLWLSQ